MVGGRDGVTFPWNDFGAFSAALDGLLAQPDAFLRALGTEAVRHVQAAYSWDAIVDAIDARGPKRSGPGKRPAGNRL